MATLLDVIDVRSQRALRLKAHLDWVARGAAWPASPWLSHGAGYTLNKVYVPSLDDVYVPPFVTPHDHTRPRLDRLTEEREALAPAGSEEGDARVPWGREWKRLRHAVVLGRAGGGKSTVLRWTSRRVARRSEAQWKRRDVPLDRIPIPIVLKAEHIIWAGSVTGAIRAAFETPLPPAANRRSWQAWPVTAPNGLTENELVAALDVEITWLFVDALDERPSEDDVPSGRANVAVATLGSVRARVLLSMRNYAWHPEQPPVPFRVVAPAASGVALPEDGIVVYDLTKLSTAQRRKLVERWHPGAAHARRRRQLIDLLDVVPMVELTNNALLLTLLCVAARNPARNISPATRRAELYHWLVSDFLARPDNPVVGLDPDGAMVQRRVGILAQAAWALWRIAQGAEFTYQQWEAQVGDATLRRQVESAGLMTAAGYLRSFFPQTLFEYLAGAGLVHAAALAPRIDRVTVEEVATEVAEHGHEDGWRELATLGIGQLAVVQRRRDVTSAVVLRALELSVAASNARRGALAAVIGEALIEAGDRDQRLPENLTGGPAGASPMLSDDARGELCGVLLATMRNADAPGAAGHVPAVVRARAGAALGWIGDPRFDPDAFWLPKVTAQDPLGGFVYVPEGRFMMGTSDEDPGFADERPPHEVRIAKPFLIARWPVTVAQWSAYLSAIGNMAPDWEGLVRDPPTWPVRRVSEFNAQKYCAWLTEQLATDGVLALLGAALSATLQPRTRRSFGLVASWLRTAVAPRVLARLPTEEEWEYVAKGGMAGRRYPYGPRFDSDAANGGETGIGTPSAVGSFGRGAACGDRLEPRAEEMSGNVWEWTSSEWTHDYRPGKPPNPLPSRAVRGGAFVNSARSLRSASRHSGHPAEYIGFRVAVSLFHS